MNYKLRSFYAAAIAVCGIGLIGTSFVPKAQADAWDKMTIVTVNEPIIAGNKVLDPGTYVWKLLDSQSNRHIVQIFDRDQRHLEETILAIPNYRLQPKGNTQFAFWETPLGVPKAVRAWFYPGDNYGQEFAYPKKLVAQLAAAVPVPVPPSYKEPEPVAVPEAAPVPQPETAAPQPEPAPAPIVAPAPQTVPTPAPVRPAPRPSALPHTATARALVGLLGLASLSAAGFLAFAVKRVS